jgi:predicted transcriptional regulator
MEWFFVCIIFLLAILISYVRDICITNDRNHYERIDRIVRKLDEIIDKLDKIEKDRSN